MDPYSYFAEAKQVCYADLHNCAHDIISGGKGGRQSAILELLTGWTNLLKVACYATLHLGITINSIKATKLYRYFGATNTRWLAQLTLLARSTANQTSSLPSWCLGQEARNNRDVHHEYIIPSNAWY